MASPARRLRTHLKKLAGELRKRGTFNHRDYVHCPSICDVKYIPVGLNSRGSISASSRTSSVAGLRCPCAEPRRVHYRHCATYSGPPSRTRRWPRPPRIAGLLACVFVPLRCRGESQVARRQPLANLLPLVLMCLSRNGQAVWKPRMWRPVNA
jgi:hypothetical protein